MIDKQRISLEINGRQIESDVEARMHLADFLRQQIRLTGTHLGCEHGVCGACTVILDGVPVRSCLMLAVQADGCNLRTIEGFAQADGALHPVQQAFMDHHGLQCGFCTPGMMATLISLLEANANRSEADIRDAVSGHICRCTGYQAIIAAGLQAARVMAEEQKT